MSGPVSGPKMPKVIRHLNTLRSHKDPVRGPSWAIRSSIFLHYETDQTSGHMRPSEDPGSRPSGYIRINRALIDTPSWDEQGKYEHVWDSGHQRFEMRSWAQGDSRLETFFCVRPGQSQSDIWGVGLIRAQGISRSDTMLVLRIPPVFWGV